MTIRELYTNRNECYFGQQKSGAPYVVFGAPFDSTSTYRPGQRFAPCEIRRALYNIEWNSSIIEDLSLEDIDIEDIGDVTTVYGDTHTTIERIAGIVEEIIEESRIPVMIGGEHLVTLGSIKGAWRAGKRPCMIIFDAHFDLRNEYLGLSLSHATVMRRIVENVGVNKLLYVGVRSWETSERIYAIEKGFEFYTSLSTKRIGPSNIASRIKRFSSDCESLYLTIDMDVIDPGHAPGVGNPEPLGLTPLEVVQLIHAAASSSKLIGMDLVEVSPVYDCSGITSVLAAKLLLEALIANGGKRFK